jgi:hypothetical protein
VLERRGVVAALEAPDAQLVVAALGGGERAGAGQEGS